MSDPHISRVFFREFAAHAIALDVTPHQVSLRPTRPVAKDVCPQLLLEVMAEGVGEDHGQPTLYAMFRYPGSLGIAGPSVHVSDDPANSSEDPCSLLAGRLSCSAYS